MPEACFAIGELIDIMPYNMIEKHLTNNTVTVNIKAIFKCIDRDKKSIIVLLRELSFGVRQYRQCRKITIEQSAEVLE